MNPVTITHDIMKAINGGCGLIFNPLVTLCVAIDTYTLLDRHLEGKGNCEHEYKSLQLEMLHLLGAILSGSKVRKPRAPTINHTH